MIIMQISSCNKKTSWILELIVWLVVVVSVVSSAAPELRSDINHNPYEIKIELTPLNEIDRLVFAQLQKLGIEPANICSDAVFIRRAYLDVLGTLPTGKEAIAFLKDTSSGKREALIDQLLKRNEFTDYWTMKWCDVLRVKAEFPINLWPNATQAYHRWIHTAIGNNMPYDQFVRELLTANGSNFRVGSVNFYRAMQSKEPLGIAQIVALTFMGERAEKWPKERLTGMAGFFSQLNYKATQEWKEEIVYFDSSMTNKEGVVTRSAVFPDGTVVQFLPNKDPRELFSDWLISPKNPWFARNVVNRVWAWLLGRGIIHEPDDIRTDNPPSNPALLAYLEKELINAKWDLKHIYRLILTSRTYQLSSVPKSNNPAAEANFARYPLRRVEAEVLIDALNQITGTTEKYTSAVPEPFTFIPDDQRSIALPDGSITSSFLEQFGRPSRDTGLESERNNRVTADQRLHMLNSSHIQRKLEQGPKMQYLLKKTSSPREVIGGLYLMILSRPPTEKELQAVQKYSQSSGLKGREAAIDLAWALINSSEFLYRH
ncbi:MAG: DUF1553 domain-containing protein [Kiritimatiellae bacterium]|nr:DUF1553 domain-containing protein [Kiritimatiellia bacterium]MDD5521967.1 DUF1553 domain-containing protein [Kiritimatiellia bacterium]